MQKPLCAVGVGQTLKCMVCTPIAEECRLIDLVSPYGFAIIVLRHHQRVNPMIPLALGRRGRKASVLSSVGGSRSRCPWHNAHDDSLPYFLHN